MKLNKLSDLRDTLEQCLTEPAIGETETVYRFLTEMFLHNDDPDMIIKQGLLGLHGLAFTAKGMDGAEKFLDMLEDHIKSARTANARFNMRQKTREIS